MFDNLDELLIDDDYAAESSTYFDAGNMYMDSAMESFSEIDVDENSDAEYFCAVESVLNAMETDLWAISMEADEAKKKFGAGIKDKADAAMQHVKNGIAKIFNGLYTICENHAAKLVKKGKVKAAAKWRNKADWCKQQAERLKGNLTKEQIIKMKEQAEKTQKACEEAIRNDSHKYGNPLITQGSLPGTKQVVATTSSEKVRRANAHANSVETKKLPLSEQYPEDPGKKALNSGKRNVVVTPSQAKKSQEDKEIHERYLAAVKDPKNPYRTGSARSVAGKSFNSFIVEDLDEGYSVAVEGLFSKPKTAEALLGKMQKKVGRLKSIGACDDMLRQLNAEAAKFNGALSSLKKASAEFQKSNDKKALKAAAGPVLKDLNKTCKLLKIKSISSDPKNITQEEITKLHDFIKGAKQLIKAKKAQLSGKATEGMIFVNDEYGNMVAMESDAYFDYDDEDDFDFNFDEFDDDDGYDDYAEESLIEDFDNADEMIAVATEGIIDPDVKRAHRIKFGEKKRQIKSVVKKARQARKAKDFATAITLYQEAKKGYAGLMTDAKKLSNRKGYDGKSYASNAKTGLINWCIKKMSECDNAIEAIRNGQMKGERKAAAKEARAAKKAAKKGEATESYLDDALEYESVIESLGIDDEDDFDFDFDEFDDDDGYDDESSLESLMM